MDRNVNVGAKFVHSGKSMKLGNMFIEPYYYIEKIKGSTLGNKCFRHFGRNPICPPLDNDTGHIVLSAHHIISFGTRSYSF